MYDSFSAEFKDAMYQFKKKICVTCVLNQGESRESERRVSRKLGLIIDLCREFLTLESGNSGVSSMLVN